MNRVPSPVLPPHQCLLTGRGSDPDGFFTVPGAVVKALDPVPYVCASIVRDMARDLGWVSPAEHAVVCEELAAAQSRVTELESRLAALEQKFDAIDVLASAGFQARKKPGRPAKAGV